MADEKPSGFASRLRLLREAAGLTQTQLAERAGLHKLGVAKLEQGLREPGWATVQALARALGLTCVAFDAGNDSGPLDEPRPIGRPRKTPPASPSTQTKKGPGRPRKATGEADGANVAQPAADAVGAKATAKKRRKPKGA